ncbi:MAG: MFS transporter [Acidimicrobiales bacterium]
MESKGAEATTLTGRFSSLRPFRHRDFAVLWGGGMVSNAGSWMQAVAVGVYVTEATGKATWTALVAVAAFLPIGVLAPVGGALADRLDRRRFVMGAETIEAALAFVLAMLFITDSATPGLVTLMVFLGGCMSALRLPFHQSVLPDVVPREDLLGAVSLGSAQYNLGRVVGPALAGLVLKFGSFELAFFINAFSYLAGIGAFALIHLPDRTPNEEGGTWVRIRAGASAARNEPGCKSAIVLIAVVAILISPFIALVPAMASHLGGGGVDATSTGTGTLTAAQGVGAVLGALAIVPLAARFGRRRMIVANLLATPTLLCVYAYSPNLTVAAGLLAVVGMGYIGILSGLSTVVQLRAPVVFRGRILSLYFVALGVLYPIGSILHGAVADVIGLQPTTVVFAIGLVVLVIGVNLLAPQVFAVLEDPEADGAAIPLNR